jgi:BRCT domain type II-containing protein
VVAALPSAELEAVVAALASAEEVEAALLVSVQVVIRQDLLTLRRLSLRTASRRDGKKATKQVGRKRTAIVLR